jgi:hypothetical protein
MLQRGFKNLKGYYVLAVRGKDDGSKFNLIWKYKEKNQYVQARPGREFTVSPKKYFPSRIYLDIYATEEIDMIVYGGTGPMIVYVKKLTEKERVPG